MFLSRVIQSYGIIIIALISVNKHKYYASTRKHNNCASLRKHNYYASAWNYFYINLTKSRITYMCIHIYLDNIFIEKISINFI